MAALPALMEELVEEILLRVPPEEPAHLIRAAMVCKAWCRILSDGGFRRRYSRFHRMPTLLGYICSASIDDAWPQFVPTTSFSPPPPPLPTASCYYAARDCRHDRLLIQDYSSGDDSPGFIVCDLIAGNRQHLSFGACAHDQYAHCYYSNDAVLCARHQHGCDHLDCHGGPFLVVSVKSHDTGGEHNVRYTCASVYSSETGAWSAKITCTTQDYDYDHYVAGGCMRPCLLIGDALYFTLPCYAIRILKYDLVSHRLSLIDTPQVFYNQAIPIDIDGGLGIVQSDGNCIYTWSHQVDFNGVGVWVRHNVIAEIETLIPTWHLPADGIIRFVEGTNTILLCLYNDDIDLGVFTLSLKSRQVRTLNLKSWQDRIWHAQLLPYTSFYAPDLAKGKLPPR